MLERGRRPALPRPTLFSLPMQPCRLRTQSDKGRFNLKHPPSFKLQAPERPWQSEQTVKLTSDEWAIGSGSWPLARLANGRIVRILSQP
jgi:hypothetical protein